MNSVYVCATHNENAQKAYGKCYISQHDIRFMKTKSKDSKSKQRKPNWTKNKKRNDAPVERQ